MAGTQSTRASALPGSGAMFALRAIGLVLLVRWLYSMIDIASRALVLAMLSSPWFLLHALLIFLLLVLPGAHARADRPFHPLPQWLRQALRLLAAIGFLFAVWSVGAFAWSASPRRVLQAVMASNGWLAVAPALYGVVVWLCQPRALWRTHVAARRFAIGRYAIAVDTATRTAIIWMESRKVGQYDARELSVRWPAGTPRETVPAMPPAVAEAGDAALAAPSAVRAPLQSARKARWFGRAKLELLWDSPAAAGHNREIVLRAPLVSEDDRVAARALDAALRQIA